MPGCPEPIREALVRLDVERLVFGIHQSAFPAGALDSGHGSPHGAAARALLTHVAGLGFDSVQLGPAGQVSTVNPAPYDGTVFAHSLMHLDLSLLCEPECFELIDRDAAAELSASVPAHDRQRVDLAKAKSVMEAAVRRAHTGLLAARKAGRAAELDRAFSAFVREQAGWLEVDALFEVMAAGLGHDDPTRFDPGLAAMLSPTPAGAAQRASMAAVMAEPLERAALGQWLCHLQGRALRRFARTEGLALFGDLQVGFSHRDRFLRADAFHPDWRLGAPPSRTNPDGQPWGYPVLDPDQLDDPNSPARRLLAMRFAACFDDYDGVRIDHPHGLVCPWIYRADDPDPLHAVQHGARAFESPDGPHPDLRRWAIATPQDLDPSAEKPWDENRVARMSEVQIARWSRLFDAMIETARAFSVPTSALCAEVLSTCPAPLAAVLSRHGLGRFRVVQKADVLDPRDVYRTDQARPADWVMLGNHDTPSIFAKADDWLADGSAEARAHYLAERLVPDARERPGAVASYLASPGALVQAHLADLFLSDARNVFVYFTDLFGEREPFNRPGIVHPDNWTLRVPRDFTRVHAQRCARGEAIDVPAELAQALRAVPGQAALAEAVVTRG